MKTMFKTVTALAVSAAMLMGVTAYGADNSPTVSEDDYISIDGQLYKMVGQNLFTNGDFSDNSGKGMDQWYVGAHIDGHPESGADMPPRIGDDGSLENLKPLAESNLLLTGSYEPSHGNDVFYFGTDNNRPEGMKHYLVENIIYGSNKDEWKSCAWNGAHSLLAFVPIKADTKYYFCFNAYTADRDNNHGASVRYGAINMDSYIPESYSVGGSLNFSGSGYMYCKNGDQQNVRGSWTAYESIIDSGDGDYFLFNAYWLQMAEFLCMGDFKLYEIEPASADGLVVSTSLTSAAANENGVNKDDLGILVDADGDGFDLAYQGETGEPVTAQEGLVGTVALFSDNSNINWEIRPYKTVTAKNASDEFNELVGQKLYGPGPFKRTSLYEEVINDLESSSYSEGSLDPNRLANANKVISAAGIIDFSDLDETRKKLLEVPEQVPEANTLRVKEQFAKLGVGFYYGEDGFYVGEENIIESAEPDTVYNQLVLSGTTVTLSNYLDAENPASVSLDAEQAELVKNLMGELKPGL